MQHADVASAATGRREQLGAGGGRPALGRKAKEGHRFSTTGLRGAGAEMGDVPRGISEVVADQTEDVEIQPGFFKNMRGQLLRARARWHLCGVWACE